MDNLLRADKLTSTNILGIGIDYMDAEGKNRTRYISLPNPKSNLTEQQIKTAVQGLIGGTTPIIVNPVTGEPLDTETAIVTAYTEVKQVREVDIGYED